MSSEKAVVEPGGAKELSLIDCDIHVTYSSEDEIVKHLPKRYQDRGVVLSSVPYSNPTGNVVRRDVVPEEELAAADRPGKKYSIPVENYRKYLLDEYGVDYGIITGYTNVMGLAGVPNRDYAAELARANNKWIREKWLSADERFVGSILIAPQNPEESVEIIEEFADDDRFVQIVMSSSLQSLLGKPEHWPIFEAAEEKGLPIAMHAGGSGPMLTETAPGSYPSSYFEWHNQFPLKYMGHLNSAVCEGVFERFDDLQFVFVEGGISWLPSMLWRMDKNWKGLREQSPWLEKPPSEYVVDSVKFTTQPIEEPPKPQYLSQIYEMIQAEKTVMFSSDFPHWDGDSPKHGLPNFSDELQERIFYKNALDVYDFPQ